MSINWTESFVFDDLSNFIKRDSDVMFVYVFGLASLPSLIS